jgi:hypothetical protein
MDTFPPRQAKTRRGIKGVVLKQKTPVKAGVLKYL